MRHRYTNIDDFLQQISGDKAIEKAAHIQQIQKSQGYLCPSAPDLAIHLILELYDSASTPEGNVVRIASSLEIAADQLKYLSRRIQAILQT